MSGAIEKHINEYQTRQWEICKFPIPNITQEEAKKFFNSDPSFQLPGETYPYEKMPRCRELTGDNAELKVHISESGQARGEADDAERRGHKISFFFIDWELIAADLDPHSGTEVWELAEDWEQHSEGSFVIVFYMGQRECPPKKVLLIEEK